MSDAKQPNSIKDAAARLILGEIVPLVEKVDQLSTSLHDVHECLDKDLQRVGAVVTTFEHSVSEATRQFAYLIDQARTVQTVIARFDATPKTKEPTLGYKQMFAVGIISSLLALAVAGGIFLLLNKDQAEQARVGRAVSKALPLLDDVTRQKLQAAVNKTGS